MKISTLLILLLFSSFSYAEVYKWTDPDGRVHFSDKKPASGNAEELDLKINTYTSASFDKSIFDVGPEVVMYSTSSCGYCKKAREYFNKNNIPYTDYNIQKNARAKSEYVKMGARGVPVILVGNKRLNGFSVKGFKNIYQ
jgi:glutaredoxin